MSSSDAQYEEFLTLFAANRERLFKYVFTLLPRHADAEDVFQRCSLVLWRKFAEFDRDRSFSSWASGVALHEVRNFLRAAGRQKLRFDSDLVTQLSDTRNAEGESSAENLKYLAGCLERLGAAERELVRQAYASDATLKEYAESTGQALQTLYNRLGRIRRQLLECIRRQRVAEALP